MPHIHEKIDFTVGALIVRRRTVLLRPDGNGGWALPSGHVELDEDPNEAIVRKMKRKYELDIELSGGMMRAFGEDANRNWGAIPGELIPPRFMNRHHSGVNGHLHVELIYEATVRDPGEVSDFGLRWFTREELDDAQYALSQQVRYYATIALNEISSH